MVDAGPVDIPQLVQPEHDGGDPPAAEGEIRVFLQDGKYLLLLLG
jgi:hypothetical protein